jgi:hypothetical protein
LRLQNITSGQGFTYQWYNSNGAISGATLRTYQTPGLFAPESYYCHVSCTYSGLSTNSSAINVNLNTFYNCYCNSSAGGDADEEIFSVTFNGAINESHCDTIAPGPGSILNRYANYRTIGSLTTVYSGNTVPFSIEADDCDQAPYYAFGAAIWIDYNQNGSFADAGEQVFLESGTFEGPRFVTGNITIPCSAKTGLTGMRITIAEGLAGSLLQPCLTYGFGETEDYLITIAPKPSTLIYHLGLAGAPQDSATSGLPVANCAVSPLSQGNNANTAQTSLLINNSNPSNYINASQANHAGITARNRSLELNDTSAYFTISLSPASGYQVTLDSISLGSLS